MKKTISFKGLLMIILLAVIVFGCKKPEDIGRDIVATPGEGLNTDYREDFKITAFSEVVDSIATKSAKNAMLGSMADPVFGNTSAGFYHQVRLTNNNINFGTNPVCDSIVLSYSYSGFYGDSSTTQHIKVFELDEKLSSDNPYYSNSKANVITTPLFDGDIVFNLSDSITVGKNKLKPHLRLKLKNSFGDKIIAKSGNSELSNNDEFLKFIKGFKVTVDELMIGGGLAYFKLTSTLSKLSIYYHNDSDTSVEDFVINENCVRFNTFDHHNYSTANPDLKAHVINGDTTQGQKEFYLQSMGGIRTYINFPDLEKLTKNNKVAVHLAELELSVASTSNLKNYPAPPHIALVGISKEGKNVFLVDQGNGKNSIGGEYNNSKRQYSYVITRTIQNILQGKSKLKGLKLIISGESAGAYRIILNGKDKSSQTRLKIYYTDVKP